MNFSESSELPIGVFDSGLGGLTVVREIIAQLPFEHIIYFGDLARLPYGIKSKRQITDFSIENTEFLAKLGVKSVVIACNSSASAAGMNLKRRFKIPILDVIKPAARSAVQASRTRRIGVLGTQATIASGAYVKILRSLDQNVEVASQACPLFVPMVEEGILDGQIARAIIRQYLEPLLRKKIDTLILGCTHYPLLKNAIQKFVGPNIQLIDSAKPTVSDLACLLESKSLLREEKKRGKLQVYVSDLPQIFMEIGERFLAKPLHDVKLVRLTEVTMVKREWAALAS